VGKPLEITRVDHTPVELRVLAGRARDGRIVRRLLGLALAMEGQGRGEAAKACGMDRQILRDWVARYNEAGVAGLTSRPHTGRHPRLSADQFATLKQIVLNGPDPEKDKVVRWRCCDLRDVIADRFGVTMHESTVGKLLNKLNLTRLQPRPADPGKSAEAEATFNKTSARSYPRRSQSAAAARR